jgi:hypothetical protein
MGKIPSETVILRHRQCRVYTEGVDRLVGIVPQTGVLMVTHERNMRSKFR